MLLNTASQSIGAQMVTAADGSAFTGSVTVAVTIDSGTQATGSVGSGACTHEGNGYHSYRPAQAETNGAHIAFTFTGTGAIPATVQVFTRAGDAFTRLGAPAGASVSADIAAVKTQTAAIETDTQDIQSRIPTALVGGRIDATVDGTGMEAGAVTAIQSGLATATELAKVPKSDGTATWNATALASINAQADTAISDAALATAANLATVAGYLDTEIAAILATTNKLDDTLEDSGGGAYIFTEASLANAPAGGGGGDATEAKQDAIIALIGTPAGVSVSADIAAVKSQTAAIETDTQDLQTQIGTDGAGLTNMPWNAAWDAEVQSECTDALNAYDPPTRAELTSDTNSVLTAVGDVPTNAELATALGTADDAVLAQIALVKAKTDSLTFTVTGKVDANITHVIADPVQTNGATDTNWGGAP